MNEIALRLLRIAKEITAKMEVRDILRMKAKDLADLQEMWQALDTLFGDDESIHADFKGYLKSTSHVEREAMKFMEECASELEQYFTSVKKSGVIRKAIVKGPDYKSLNFTVYLGEKDGIERDGRLWVKVNYLYSGDRFYTGATYYEFSSFAGVVERQPLSIKSTIPKLLRAVKRFDSDHMNWGDKEVWGA